MNDSNYLNDVQEVLLAVLPVGPALLSIAASSLLLRLLLQQSKLKSTYDRIIFGMSVGDILLSTVCIFFPFLVPADSSRRLWAFGTDATCQGMATLYAISSASFWYSGCLSVYFLLLIRTRVPGGTIARKYEPWMHLLSVGWPLVAGIAGIPLGAYQEHRMGPGCSVVDNPIFGYLALAFPLLVGMVVITANNILIVRYVRTTFKKSSRWRTPAAQFRSQQQLGSQEQNTNISVPRSTAFAFGNRSTSSFSNLSLSSGMDLSLASGQDLGSTEPETARPARRSRISLGIPASLRFSNDFSSTSSAPSQSPADAKMQLVAEQSILYVTSIYIVWIWPLAKAIAATSGVRNEQDIYWLLLLQSIMLPLQGIFNALIYVRPRYLSRRRQYQLLESKWKSLKRVLLPRRKRKSKKGRQPPNHPYNVDDNNDTCSNLNSAS